MNSHIKIVATILAIVLGLRPAKVQENVEDDNSNELLQRVLALKAVTQQLEAAIEKLNTGMGQQAEIVYDNKRQDFEENPQSPESRSFSNREILKDYKQKLFSLEKNVENFLAFVDDVCQKKEPLMAIRNCWQEKSGTNLGGDILQQQINRWDLLQDKLDNLHKNEEMLAQSFENLSKIMTEVSFALDKENEDFEFLEKQLPIMQDSSRTLDDFIILRNQHLDFHHKCTQVN